MNKIGPVAITVGFGIAAYLILLVTQTVVVSMSVAANTTMSASSNMSNYPGTSEFLIAIPWILWFVPGTVVLIAIVLILKRR